MADTLTWYLWTQVLALAGWLVASRWLARLPDRGYGASKALGVLLSGFVFWMSVTAGVALNNAGGALLAVSLVAGLGVLLHLAHRRGTGASPRLAELLPNRPVLITVELVFALSFLACAVYRSYTPDIANAGGEKFMEMMFINSILRSPVFPPNDGWLSGFSISYYYFGYVIFAMITRLSGVAPAVAFNLGGATVFGLTLTGAFSLGFNLWAAAKRVDVAGGGRDAADTVPMRRPAGDRKALLAGLATAIMLGVMGNLGGLIEAGRCAGVVSQDAWRWLDIHNRDAANARPECAGLAPTRFYWWWNWSRVVHDYSPTGGDMEVITESPTFSFILGDNHPHVMALPFVLVAATLALHFYLGGWSLAAWDPRNGRPVVGGSLAARAAAAWRLAQPLLRSPELLLTAIVAGGLSFMNTWDFPVYGALIVGALVLRRLTSREPLLPAIAFSVGVFVLGYVLYLPFYATFSSQARGIGVNLFNGTRFTQFFLMFAPFVLAMPGFVWLAAREFRLPAGRTARKAARLAAGLTLALAAAAALLGLANPTMRAVASEFASTGQAFGVGRAGVEQAVASRGELERVLTPAFLLVVAAACGAIVLTHIGQRRAALSSSGADAPAQPAGPALTVTPFVLLLFIGGALLTVSVEIIYLQDNFGTRMNTVFKFYYMAWVVWAVAGGHALMRFIDGRGPVAKTSAIVVGLAAVAGLLYPLFAAQSKADNFRNAPTLDGSAYLRRFQAGDAAAIEWLNRNVQGAAVVAEAPGDKFASYKYEGRVSAFTGLPTLLGWGGHQNQWRGNYTEPGKREPDIETLFQTTSTAEAQAIARRYGVAYVVVGPPERQRYRADGLAKFDQIGTAVFRSGDTTIYRVQ